jgi:membrane protease YdiL (CAAX protease family)
LFVSVAIAAFAEELAFRAVLIGHFSRLLRSVWGGAVLSILLFSIAHCFGYGILYGLRVLPTGAVLSLLFLWKRDLGACMLAHFLVDAIGVLALKFMHG